MDVMGVVGLLLISGGIAQWLGIGVSFLHQAKRRHGKCKVLCTLAPPMLPSKVF